MPKRTPSESLRELVTAQLAKHDMSGREFSRRAEKAGYSVSYTTVNGIANGTRSRVTDDTLQAIAVVFGLPADRVYVAAGTPPPDSTTDPELLALHKTLTPEEKRQALEMYRANVKALKAMRSSS